MSGATILGRMADRSSMLEVPAARQGARRAVRRRRPRALPGRWKRPRHRAGQALTRSGLRDLGASGRDHAAAARLGRAGSTSSACAFGTVGALKDGERLEITTYRKEVYAEEHRKPSVTFGDDILVDLSRRDFTINAMAVRLPDGEFVDPYGGLKALAAKLLDTPLDPEIVVLRRPAADDPRRAVRRAARCATGRPCGRGDARAADRLAIVSAERIRDELDKLLVGEHAPAGLALLVDDRARRCASCPSSRRSAWSRTRSTGTRTCCATPTRWSTGASPTSCCGWRRCCTTSASPRRGRSRPRV